MFESARKLAGGEIQDFEDAVFDIGMSTSQTQSSVITSLEASADEEDMPRPSLKGTTTVMLRYVSSFFYYLSWLNLLAKVWFKLRKIWSPSSSTECVMSLT